MSRLLIALLVATCAQAQNLVFTPAQPASATQSQFGGSATNQEGQTPSAPPLLLELLIRRPGTIPAFAQTSYRVRVTTSSSLRWVRIRRPNNDNTCPEIVDQSFNGEGPYVLPSNLTTEIQGFLIGNNNVKLCVYGILRSNFTSGAVPGNGYHHGMLQFAESSLSQTRITNYRVTGAVFPVYGFSIAPYPVDAGVQNSAAFTVSQSAIQQDEGKCSEADFTLSEPSYIDPNVTGFLTTQVTGVQKTQANIQFVINRAAMAGAVPGQVYGAIVQAVRRKTGESGQPTYCRPGVAADATILVTATDAPIEPPPPPESGLRVLSRGLPTGTVGRPYEGAQIVAADGTPPYKFFASSNLPPGITLSEGGSLGGTPSREGSFEISIYTIDSGGNQSPARTFSLVVNPERLDLPVVPLTPAVIGRDYSQRIEARGGTPPHRYVLSTNQRLPNGLTLTSDGMIQGRATIVQTVRFTVDVSDSSVTRLNARSEQFTLEVVESLPPRVNPQTLPSATLGQRYTQPLTASGGIEPLRFSVSGGNLPSNLSLTPEGVISGTPGQTGTFNFDVVVRDSAPTPVTSPAQRFTLMVSGTAVTVVSRTLPEATANRAYDQQTITATGGLPPYRFELAAGSSLPGDLSLSAAGVISGTPRTGGTYTLDLIARDSASPPQNSQPQRFTLVVRAASGATGTISASPNPLPLPAGISGGPISIRWRASGVQRVDIRVGSPEGPSMTGFVSNESSADTGDWVRNGMVFYLQNADGGESAGAARTIATTRVFFQAFLDRGPFRILSRSSNLPIEIAAASQSPNAAVQQNRRAGSEGALNQHFFLEAVDGGYYLMVARHSSKVLEVAPGTGAGAAVVQGPRRSGDEAQRQHWIAGRSVDALVFQNRLTGFALALPGPNADAGTALVQDTLTGDFGAPHQQFLLEQVAATGISGVLSLEANPLRLEGGASSGIARLRWSTTGVDRVQVRVNAPDGSPFEPDGPPNGGAATDSWASNGMTFFLVSGSTTLSQVTAFTTNSANRTVPAIDANVTLSAVPAACGTPAGVTAFPRTAAEVVHYFRVTDPLAPAFSGDRVIAEWIDPSGAIFQQSSVAAAGERCYSARLPIPTDRPGVWRVNRYWNEDLIATTTFTIQ